MGGPAAHGYTGSLLLANDTVKTEDQRRLEEEPGVWTTGPDGELIPDYGAAFPTITEGEVVDGTVVRIDKDEVLVDIGYKSEGVIPVSELSIRRSVNPADEVVARGQGRRARAHEGGRRGPADPLEEARPLRARLEEHRGRRRVAASPSTAR